MKVYFSTVVRTAPTEQGGEIVCLDWNTKTILNRKTIYPSNPTVVDPNPRGNSRGGRGIELHNGRVMVANYHSLQFFTPELEAQPVLSHGLMAGLHETYLTKNNSVWVASTAIDAALEYDLASGELLNAYWPREMPSLQKAFDLKPLAIDKSADNRLTFLAKKPADDTSHVHLNAVTMWKDDVYALFCKKGAVVNLTQGTVVLRDPLIKGGHNVHFLDDDHLIVNGTVPRKTCIFNVKSGKCEQIIDVNAFKPVRKLVWFDDLRYKVEHPLFRAGLRNKPNRPVFVRGLEVTQDKLFVGMSPASILCIDRHTGALLDMYNYSTDLRACIHGIKVAQ